METDQIDRRVTWLDEQRRKDSEELGRILERLESVEQALRSHGQQVQDLSAELSRTSALAAQVRQFDDAVSKHRLEISNQLEAVEERRISREEKLESLRKSDQKQVAQELDSIRKDLRRLSEFSDRMEARKQEEIRLTRAQDAVQKRIEALSATLSETARPMAALQEGRRQDGVRLGELEARVGENAKKADRFRALIESAGDQIAKIRTKSSELEGSEKELRQAQSLWTEQQAIKLAEFERSWTVWGKRFEEFEIRAVELDKRMESYEETYREMLSLRNDLGDVVERLERRIVEVSELQRLGDERQKGEWSAFQADDQKRWSSFKLSAEEIWKEHDRLHSGLESDLQTAQADLEDTMLGLAEFSRQSREWLAELMTLTQNWVSDSRERAE